MVVLPRFVKAFYRRGGGEGWNIFQVTSRNTTKEIYHRRFLDRVTSEMKYFMFLSFYKQCLDECFIIFVLSNSL